VPLRATAQVEMTRGITQEFPFGFGCMPEGPVAGFAGGLKVTGMLCPRWQVPQVTVF
jgi:hypothetical protein